MTPQRRKDRGAALVYVAVFLAVIVGATAVGIDVARLAHTAAEVQAVADAAARGGAKALSENGGTPGDGIARAHDIAALNFMDGEASPEADVLVDEGFYNFVDKVFECCQTGGAYNTPCCQDEWAGCTQTVTGGDCAEKRSAVVAVPHTNVTNLFAGVFDFMDNGRLTATADAGSPNRSTRVEKVAIAGSGGPSRGCSAPPECTNANDWGCFCSHGFAPCLPIAANACEFNDDVLPTLTVAPGSGTAGWTSFQDTPTNANKVRGYMDQSPTCNVPGSPSIPGTQQTFGDGSWVDINNGTMDPAFVALQCVYDNNLGCGYNEDTQTIAPGPGRYFTIPIFQPTSCGGIPTGNENLVGFATVKITGVTSQGSDKQVTLQTVSVTTDDPQPVGGGCFQTDCRVVMAR